MAEVNKKTLFILANYFGEEDLISFICNQLFTQKNIDLHIAIVDNGSRSNLLEEFQKNNEQVYLFSPKENTGYIGAARLVYEDLVQRNKIKFDYYLLSNYDLDLCSPLTLSTLIDFGTQNHLDVWAPQIKNLPDGGYSNPLYRKRISLTHLRRLKLIYSSMLFYIPYQMMHRVKKKFKAKNIQSGSPCCYAIHGSMMVFSNNYFDQGGHFNFSGFLYGEELFFAEECLIRNLKVGFSNEIVITHKEHATTGIWKDNLHRKYLLESIKQITETYFSEK